MRGALALVVLASFAGAGCDSNPPPASCSTKADWTEGDSGNPLMRPGEDCITCHEQRGGDEAPRFEVAGTVMGAYHDDDDCNGIAGVIVRLTGSDGKTVELETNPAGNFYRTIGEGPPIATPFSVEIEKNGKTRAMRQMRSTGDCMSCHTSEGAQAAPGRILVP